jgi:hypothetical protein
MFSDEFMHVIRNFEIDRISKHVAADARILQVSGGTGYQARQQPFVLHSMTRET